MQGIGNGLFGGDAGVTEGMDGSSTETAILQMLPQKHLSYCREDAFNQRNRALRI